MYLCLQDLHIHKWQNLYILCSTNPIMAEFDQTITKGTEAWNIAQGYTYLKVLKLLVELDKLVNIALYGVENIEDTFQVPQDMKTHFRLIAINRLLEELKKVIENTKFVLSKPNKELILEYRIRLTKVEFNLEFVKQTQTDMRTKEEKTIILEKQFRECLDELRNIKEEINQPLNDASLIFPSSDEIDLDKLQNKLIFGG